MTEEQSTTLPIRGGDHKSLPGSHIVVIEPSKSAAAL